MKKSFWSHITAVLLSIGSALCAASDASVQPQPNQPAPLGQPGTILTYRHAQASLPATVIKQITLTLGPVAAGNETRLQWLRMQAVKENKESFQVWLLCSAYPSAERTVAQQQLAAYILQCGTQPAVAYRHARTQATILPATGAWPFLLPRTEKGDNPGNLTRAIHIC